ncbi:MAG: phosphatase PAP2 family protein [Chloroflexi bacterium]|nr:phosphatase PAP2 family protein [Chloroflexota bacterium]
MALTVLLIITIVLTQAAAGVGVLPGDVTVAHVVQAVPVAGAESLAWFAFWAGSAPVVLIVAALLAFVLWRHGHIRLVAIVLGILVLRALNPLLKFLVASPRPTTEQVLVTELAPEYGFPSGHTMGATLLYGGVIWLAERTIAMTWVRRLVQVVAAVIILITGFGRVHTGAHWPSDVLGGFLWGCTGLVLLLIIAGRFVPREGLETHKRQGPQMWPRSLSTDSRRATGQQADRDRARSDGRVRP